jgi:hypothetical protein
MIRIAIAAVCAVLLSGCVSNFGLRIGHTGVPATQPSVGPGASFSSGGASASITNRSSGAALGAAIGIGALGVLFGGESGAAPGSSPDPARVVHEQDCTRPIENPAANLRCR